MFTHHRFRRYCYLHAVLCLSLLLLVTTACKKTGNNKGGDTSASETSETLKPSESESSSIMPNEEEEPESKPSQDDTPVTDTGLADLEKIVDDIAPEEEQPKEGAVEIPANGVALALAVDGLQVVTLQTGSIQAISFEVDSDLATQVVANALGKPKEITAANECPAGPMTVTTWANGFSINTADQKFLGWSVSPSSDSQDLTTVAGVGIGTTLSDLKAAYSVEVFDSSLGTEFNVGQLSGLLSANTPDAVITNLWAGTNCIFR